MKRTELKQLIKEVIAEYDRIAGFDDTPYTGKRASDGWSGDALAVSAEECQALEQAARKLANAANHVVLVGEEGITDLSRALDEYEKFIKS